MALRDDWKSTGKELGGSFKHLGKSLIKSVRVGVQKATDWADEKDEPQAPADAAAESPAEETADAE